MDSLEESKRRRDEDFEELMAACEMAKNGVRKDNPLAITLTSPAKEDVDAIPVTKPSASRTTEDAQGRSCNPRSNTAVATERNTEEAKVEMQFQKTTGTDCNPGCGADTLPMGSNGDLGQTHTTANLEAARPARYLDGNPDGIHSGNSSTGIDRNPRVMDKVDSSAESDPLTVVERDANGFVYYKCRFCGLTFNYMNTLRAHERVHNIYQPFVCGKCGDSYEFACQLEYHTQQHSDAKGYKCECGRTFFSYTEMLYHKHPEDLEKEKEDKELYSSPVLVHPSTSRVALLQDMPTPAYVEQGFEPKHPLKVYSDVRSKPYICEYCSKSYADSRQLAYHMYSHRGERQFNPRSSRYLMGREGIGYTDRNSYFLFPRTSGYVPPLY